MTFIIIVVARSDRARNREERAHTTNVTGGLIGRRFADRSTAVGRRTRAHTTYAKSSSCYVSGTDPRRRAPTCSRTSRSSSRDLSSGEDASRRLWAVRQNAYAVPHGPAVVAGFLFIKIVFSMIEKTRFFKKNKKHV